jgi:putative ABC transport system permease protein
LRTADILRLALSALYQQKVRTSLTTLGVVVGSLVLLLSLSIGVGVRDAVLHQIRRHDDLRKVEVRKGYGKVEEHIPPAEVEVKGEMSDAKRKRLHDRLVQSWIRKNGYPATTPLSVERLQEIREWPHVESVTPLYFDYGRAILGAKGEDVQTASATVGEKLLRGRLVAGDWFAAEDDRSVVVSEYLLYLWGMASDEEVRGAIGRKMRLEYHTGVHKPMMLMSLFGLDPSAVDSEQEKVLQKVVQRLPEVMKKLDLTPKEMETLRRTLQGPALPKMHQQPDQLISAELTIAAVFRGPEKGDPQGGSMIERYRPDADVILPVGTAQNLFLQNPYHAEFGVDAATVLVDDENHVKEVADRVEALGLGQYSLAEFAQRLQTNVLLLTLAMSFIALVALLVAALGITNTLVMSVLERTHEIGVMKAMGARDRHVLLLFLVEGTLVGLIGGGLGLLCGWLLSFPGDAVARSLMERQSDVHMDQSLFAFPLWLALGVPLFATLVTTLAALYPAQRAARVNPIEALRHE